MNLRRVLIGLAAAAATIFVGSAAAQADVPEPEFDPNPVYVECFADKASSELRGKYDGDKHMYKAIYYLFSQGGGQIDGGSIEETDSSREFSLTITEREPGTYKVKVKIEEKWETKTPAWETYKEWDLELEVLPAQDCPSLEPLQVTPEPVTNVCPADTATATVTGKVANHDPDSISEVNLTVWKDGTEVENNPSVPVEEDGSYSWEIPDLTDGSYTVSGSIDNLGPDGSGQIEADETEFDVEIGDCAALADVLVDPNPVVNECPAMTGDTTVSGQIASYNADSEYVVGVEVFSDGSSTPLDDLSDSDVEVDSEGAFSHDVTGIGAGEYIALVTLEENGEVTEEYMMGFLVDISECSVEPDPTVLTGEIVDITRDGCEVTLSTETSEAGDFRIEVWDDGEHIDTVEWTQDDAGAHDAVWMITQPAMEGAPGVGFALYAQDDDVVPLDGVDPYEYPAEVADECAGVTDAETTPAASDGVGDGDSSPAAGAGDGDPLPATGAGDAAQTAALIIAGVMVSAGVALVAIRRVRASSSR